MPFARQVSIGRVALIEFPEADAGKLVVISDVVSPTTVRGGRQEGGKRCASCSALHSKPSLWTTHDEGSERGSGGSMDAQACKALGRRRRRRWRQQYACLWPATTMASVPGVELQRGAAAGVASSRRLVAATSGSVAELRAFAAYACSPAAAFNMQQRAAHAAASSAPHVSIHHVHSTDAQCQLLPAWATRARLFLPAIPARRLWRTPMLPQSTPVCARHVLETTPAPPPLLPALLQALVDWPGQTRRKVLFKRLALTDFTVEIPRLAKKAVLTKALEEAGALACCVGSLALITSIVCSSLGREGRC